MLALISIRTLLSSEVTVWFLVITLGITILGSIFIRPEHFSRSHLNVLISILASEAVLVIGLSLLISSYNLEQQEEVTRKSFTKEAVDKLWLFPNQLIVNSVHARPEFLKSFYTNNPNLYQLPTTEEPPTVLAVLEEQNIAFVLIQAWEDFLTVRALDQTGDVAWVNSFLRWAQSSYLEEYFKLFKYSFKETTIQLAALLFEYAQKIPMPTTDAAIYESTTLKLLNDSRAIALFKTSTAENK